MNPTNLLSYIYTISTKHSDKSAFISETSAFTFSEFKSKTEIRGSFIADKEDSFVNKTDYGFNEIEFKEKMR